MSALKELVSDTIVKGDSIYIYVHNSDLLDVVSKVDGFYSNAWNTYATNFGVIGIVFGLFGVILGVIFPLIQSSKQDEKNKEFENKIKAQKEAFDKTIIKQKKEMNKIDIEHSKVKEFTEKHKEYLDKEYDKKLEDIRTIQEALNKIFNENNK